MLIAATFCKISLVAGLVLGEISLNISKPYSELTNYLKWAQVEYWKIHPTIGVVRANDICTKDLGDYFLGSRNLYPLYIENKGSAHLESTLVKSKSIVAFLTSLENFKKTLEESYKLMFWHPQAHVHFIICEPVPDYNWIEASMKLIWSYTYLNFVVVYIFNDRLEVLSYNPFNNTVLNYTENYNSTNVFASKVQDVYGHEVRATMIEDVRNQWKNGRFFGEDGELLTKFINKLNASIKYLIPNEQNEKISLRTAFVDISAGRSDFVFGTRVLTSVKNLTFSYPHVMDDVVIVIPKARKVPQYLNLLLTFHYKLWIAIGILLLIEMVVTTIVQKWIQRTTSCRNTQLNVYMILLNVAVPDFSVKPFPIKLLLIFWSYFAFIICASFQTSLTSSLVVPKYYSELNTVEEIMEEGLTICISPFHADMIKEEPIYKHFHTSLSRQTMIEMMQREETSCAYALPKSYVTAIIQRQIASGKHLYHIASEHIIPSLAVHYFPTRSPFLSECDRLIESDKEFGFMEKRGHLRIQGRQEKLKNNSDDKSVLSLDHLQTGFYVLLLGYLLSGSVFLFEIFRHKFEKRATKLIKKYQPRSIKTKNYLHK